MQQSRDITKTQLRWAHRTESHNEQAAAFCSKWSHCISLDRSAQAAASRLRSAFGSNWDLLGDDQERLDPTEESF